MFPNNQRHEEELSWEVDEYDQHERSRRWYGGAVSAGIIFLVYSFFSANFLFAVIVVLTAFILILRHGQAPDKIKVRLSSEGLTVGNKFYDYDEIKDFSVVYKPQQGIKGLYFEFDNFFRPRLSIPLEKMNPLKVRGFLLKYLKEDLNRIDEPFSERLGKILKL